MNFILKEGSTIKWLRMALVASLFGLPTTAPAQTFTGEARAIDGDSLSVSGIEVRLFGIDAPEGKQTCNRNGQEWPCGEAAAGKLQSLIADQKVVCRGKGRDAFGRMVAVCQAGLIELNRSMVSYGWATAFRSYSQDYIADELRAKTAKLGIWDSTFLLPEDFRRLSEAKEAPVQRSASRANPVSKVSTFRSSDGSCLIKGNHSRRGDWIYHLPGMPYYAATRPEAWFCTEAEAQAAGYRRAIVR